MSNKSRRQFIQQSAGFVLSLPALASLKVNFQDVQYPKVLFRLGWNVDDNDDVAVIPALYRLGQKSIQMTELYLWLYDSNSEIIEMLKSNFTDLKIVTGEIDESGLPSSDELKEILGETDLFFYSTGAANQVDWSGNGGTGIETNSLQYCLDNKIPYAIMGIGEIPEDNTALERFLTLANGADYIFSTSSLIDEKLKEKSIKIQKLQELPSPLFAFDLRNLSQSMNILEQYNLQDKDFLSIDFRVMGLPEEKVVDYSEKILSLITTWVQETGKHVLILPNNPADIEVTLRRIYQPLALNVKPKVIFLQEKLRPDVAASIYEKARVVSAMSLFPACSGIQSGIPVYFLSSADLSTRAQTIEDMGLKNSVQELDSSTGESLAETLLEINSKYVSGIIESDKAREYAMKKLILQFEDVNKFINKTAGKGDDSKNKKKKNKRETRE
jgi:hypothetical protein